jgi:hypothetical protein
LVPQRMRRGVRRQSAVRSVIRCRWRGGPGHSRGHPPYRQQSPAVPGARSCYRSRNTRAA